MRLLLIYEWICVSVCMNGNEMKRKVKYRIAEPNAQEQPNMVQCD